MDPGRGLRPLVVNKPRLSGHLQAQAMAHEADSSRESLLPEEATQGERRKQNIRDITGMKAELQVYEDNVKGEGL